MDDSWKTCGNCADVFCPFTEDEACESWLAIECPRCGNGFEREFRWYDRPKTRKAVLA